MLSFLVSIVLTALCCPLWMILGLLKGCFDFIIFIISKYYWVFEQNFLDQHQLPMRDTLTAIVIIPFMAVWEGIKGFFDPVQYLWDFSRNEHPVLIFFICLGLSFFYFVYLPEKLKSK
mgnify:CR=1 FL=1